MALSEWWEDQLYEDCVRAVTSYILRRGWYPNNSERGYISRARLEGRKPDVLVQEFVSKYGEGNLTQRELDGAVCPSCKSTNTFEAIICVNCGAHSAPRR